VHRRAERGVDVELIAAEAVGSGDAALERQFPRVTADLACWTAAAKAQRERAAPPC